jgi:cytochrome c-type biogenesis protein CcmF
MVLVVFVIGLLTAITQYFKYKDTTRKYFWTGLLWPTIVAVAISALITIFGNVDYEKYGAGFLAAIHIAIWAACL